VRKARVSVRPGNPSSPPGGGNTGAEATDGGREIGGGALKALEGGLAGDCGGCGRGESGQGGPDSNGKPVGDGRIAADMLLPLGRSLNDEFDTEDGDSPDPDRLDKPIGGGTGDERSANRSEPFNVDVG